MSNLHAALADLELIRHEVIEWNGRLMKNTQVQAWLRNDGNERKEPDNAIIGIVSTAPVVQIYRHIDAAGGISVGIVAAAIEKMQRDLRRARKRIAIRDQPHNTKAPPTTH